MTECNTFLKQSAMEYWDIHDIPDKMHDYLQARIALILEKKEDIEVLKKIRESFNGDLVTLAVTPEVCWELEKLGIEYVSIDHYSKDEDILEQGLKNFRRVEEICNRIDSTFSSMCYGTNNIPLKPASDNFFSIKKLYDAITIRIQILHNLFENMHPDLFLYCSSYEEVHTTFAQQSASFNQNERIYSILLGLPGLNFNAVKIITNKRSNVTKQKIDENIHTVNSRIEKFKTKSIIVTGFYIFKHNGVKGLFSYIGQRLISLGQPRKQILLIGSGYSWEYATKKIAVGGYDISSISKVYAKDPDQTIIPPNPYCGYSVMDELLFRGIDFSNLFMERLNQIIREACKYAPALMREIETIIMTRSPSIIITSAHTNFFENMALRTISSFNIPILVWQHGSQGFTSSPMMYYEELMHSDHYFCFGRGVKEMYEGDHFNRFKCNIAEIGSVELEKIYLNSTVPQKIANKILYATSNYSLNDFYISPDTILYDNQLWNTQKKILDVLGKNKVDAIFKMHPGQKLDEHLYEYISKNNYSRMKIIKNQKSFTNLIKDADIIIIDFPSTILLEAIAAKKIIFVFLKHQKIVPRAFKLLKNRVYCSNDIDEFVSMIACFLNNQPLEQQPDINNTEFLECYGVYKIDGKVVDRAINMLNHISRID